MQQNMTRGVKVEHNNINIRFCNLYLVVYPCCITDLIGAL